MLIDLHYLVFLSILFGIIFIQTAGFMFASTAVGAAVYLKGLGITILLFSFRSYVTQFTSIMADIELLIFKYFDFHVAIFRNCFQQAVKWDLMEKNPALLATVPKHKAEKREFWTAETLMHALEVCDDDRLRIALNLAFSCSLRMGEILGLTWDCCDISKEAIETNQAYIYVNKELQRVTKDAVR